jgi:hypothetical protein
VFGNAYNVQHFGLTSSLMTKTWLICIKKVQAHARDFITSRLAPAFPAKDGKQTPWRGHPVFVAQHATATCCRGCLEKWYGITKGLPLNDSEQDYIVHVIMYWLKRQNVEDISSCD